MMIDRRIFIASATLVAIAPSLELLPRQISTHEKGPNRIIFMIEGWSTLDETDTSDQVWLRVGHSWRTAWR
jgi:hypothetical protein